LVGSTKDLKPAIFTLVRRILEPEGILSEAEAA